jgi:aminotransferase in exopolysaccharide biosynthesis
MRNFIPLSIPNFEGNERKYVDEAVEQGWVSTGGKFVEKFESDLSNYVNGKVVACQSGTSAIHLALIDARIGISDMVIVPTLTFIAAINPVKYVGAKPIFMDCDDTLCMDPVKLNAFCENECYFEQGNLKYKKNGNIIKAIIVVHVFGNLADLDGILTVAEKYNLKVIEDATEALGSRFIRGKYKGKYAGTIGDYGAYSFNGNKIITTGGGGALVTKSVETAKHIKYLSTQAKDDALFYKHNEIGYNYRMTNVQAAIGVAQLEEIDEFIFRKQNNYKLYKNNFNDFNFAHIVDFRDDIVSNTWFYSLNVDIEVLNCGIREVINELHDENVQTRPIWGLNHRQIPYKDDINYKINKAEWFENRIINIPCSTSITKEEINYVSEAVKEVIVKHLKE